MVHKKHKCVSLAQTLQRGDTIVHKLYRIKSTHMCTSRLRSLSTGSSAAALEPSLPAAAHFPYNMRSAAGFNLWSNFGVHANPRPCKS